MDFLVFIIQALSSSHCLWIAYLIQLETQGICIQGPTATGMCNIYVAYIYLFYIIFIVHIQLVDYSITLMFYP